MDTQRLQQLKSTLMEKAQPKTLLISSAVAVFLAALVTGHLLAGGPLADDLCPSSVSVHRFILIDTTTALKKSTIRALKRQVIAEVEALSPGDRVSVAVMTPDADSLTEMLFSMCKVKHPEKANSAYEQAHTLEERYTQFTEELTKALTQLEGRPASNTSPIIETLYEVVTMEHVTSLVLMSDMLEHSPPETSFFRAVPSFESFKDDLYITAVRDKLSSAIVVQLQGAKYEHQQEQAKAFWRDYFEFAGTEVEITTIQEAFNG